jgi:hypothetical protein
LVPANLTAEAQSAAGSVVAYGVTALDGANRSIPANCTPPSGSIFPLATTVVACSAAADGLTATASFSITVVDRTPPAVNVPAGRTVRTTRRTGTVVRWAASALDVVDGAVSVACSPRSGSRLRVGTTRIRCAATDQAGNQGSRTFAVRVVLTRNATRAGALLAPAPGARLKAPPLLRWRPVPRARFYNVQVYRAGRKVLTAWPAQSRFSMRATWTHRGRTVRLTRGVYTWYVWPSFRTNGRSAFGSLLGQSSFRIT